MQTNCTLRINGAPVVQSISIGATNSTTRNAVPMQSGNVMLGYLDPDKSIGDPGSQYVLYSDIRVVELSPYITNQAASVIVTNGANVTLASGANYGTAPVTSTWYTAPATTPGIAVLTNTAAASNLLSTLTLNGVQAGTNYLTVFSDQAGSVTGAVAQLEVIAGPTNLSVNAGSNSVQFAVIPNGPSAPTAYQWRTNGVAIANGNHYAGGDHRHPDHHQCGAGGWRHLQLLRDQQRRQRGADGDPYGQCLGTGVLGHIHRGPEHAPELHQRERLRHHEFVHPGGVHQPCRSLRPGDGHQHRFGRFVPFPIQIAKGTNATMFYRLLHN